jgi:excisionase family DNA binding protein
MFASEGTIMRTDPSKLFYTTAEAKAALGIGLTRLYELIGSGRLRARKLGKTTLIEADSMRALAAALPFAKINAGTGSTIPQREEDGSSA